VPAAVPASEMSSPPLRPTQSRSLLLDLYGAYVRDLGGWAAVADLVRLLGELGVDEQVVRSSVSRMLRRGLLARRRVGSRVGYVLTATAETILAEGDRRIYARTAPADLTAGWVLAVFSVPERERRRRHQLRSQLAWQGFGNLAAGVWLAPRRALDDARATVEQLGLTDCVELFTAHYAAFGAPRDLVARCWELDDLGARYAWFVDAVGPVLARWRRRRGVAAGRWDGAAFIDYTCLLHEWRKMPYLDPGLPPEVLPADWQGQAAKAHFDELVERLHKPATRYVEALLRGTGGA
jgi:phenylacetic acid degradation operon negative regulatory protein